MAGVQLAQASNHPPFPSASLTAPPQTFAPLPAAWRPTDRGDELQSASRPPDMPALPPQPQHKRPAMAPGTALFEGLDAAPAAAAGGAPAGPGQPLWRNPLQQPRQDASGQPAPPHRLATAALELPAQQQQQPTVEAAALFAGLEPAAAAPQTSQGLPSPVQRQTLSQAQRQVGDLLGGLADTPAAPARPLPPPLPMLPVLAAPQPAKQEATEEQVADRQPAEVQPAEEPAPLAEQQPEPELQPLGEQQPDEPEQQPSDEQQQAAAPEEEGEEEWADAAAAADPPGSQGDDDPPFVDAAEALPVAAATQEAAPAPEGTEPW